MRLHVAVLAALAAAQDDEEWTDAKLLALADDAKTLKEEVCIDVEVDREGALEQLESFSLANDEGESLLEQILEESNQKTGADGKADLMGPAQEKIMAQITSPGMLAAALGIPFAFFSLIFWSFCCWQWWPCCKCCRRCRKDRGQSNGPKKLILLAWTGFGVVACLVAAGLGNSGAGAIVDGIDLLLCGASNLAHIVMSGRDGGFMGMIPLIQTIDGLLTDTLAQGSPFLQELEGILDTTLPIEAASVTLAQTIALASAGLGDAANAKPRPTGVTGNIVPRSADDFAHACKLCSALAGPLAEVSSAIKEGAGQALTDSRAQISERLQGSELDGLRDQMAEMKTPLEEFRSMIGTSFEPLVGADAPTKDMAELAQTAVTNGSLALLVLILFFPLTFTLLAVAYCFCKEVTDKGGDDLTYNAMPRRWAACAWCCSFLFAFFAFFFGGLLSVIAVPVSGLCLFLINTNGPELMSYKAFGFGTEEPECAATSTCVNDQDIEQLQKYNNEMMYAEAWETCFNVNGDAFTGEILNVMKFDRCPTGYEAKSGPLSEDPAGNGIDKCAEGEAGCQPCVATPVPDENGNLPAYDENDTEAFEKVTAKEFIDAEVAGKLDGAFKAVEDIDVSIDTASSPEFATLLDLFKNYDVGSFYQMDTETPFSEDARFAAMALDPRTTSNFAGSAPYCTVTSLRCADQATQPSDQVDEMTQSADWPGVAGELSGYDTCAQNAVTMNLASYDPANPAADVTATGAANCGGGGAATVCAAPSVTGGATSDAGKILAACKEVMNQVQGTGAFVTKIETALAYLAAGGADPNSASLSAVWNFNSDGTNVQETCHPCQAAKNWMMMKNKVRDEATFKCYYFEDPDNAALTCDPKDTMKVCANPGEDISTCEFKWENDCTKAKLNEKGVMKFSAKLKAVDCTFAQFQQWYTDTAARIEGAADRMDAEVAAIKPKIVGSLKSAVQTNMIDPLFGIVDGMKCKFMGESFDKFLDGMCRKTVPGIGAIGQAYVALGVFLCLVIITLNYTIWRYVGDNIIEQNAAADETE